MRGDLANKRSPLHVISDGTSIGTKVYGPDGEELTGVEKLEIIIEAGKPYVDVRLKMPVSLELTVCAEAPPLYETQVGCFTATSQLSYTGPSTLGWNSANDYKCAWTAPDNFSWVCCACAAT